MDKELSAWFSSDVKARNAADADEAINQPFFQGENTSDPSASAEQVFSDAKNSVDAVSSILAFCSAQTGFHPSSQSISDAAKTYNAYITKVSTFPGFTSVSTRKTPKQADENIDRFVRQLLSVYDHAVDEAKAISSMAKMANTVKSQSNLDESNTLFNQMSVDGSSDSAILTVGNVVLKMKKNILGQKTYVADQDTEITAVSFRTNNTYLKAHASALASRIPKETMDNWLRDNSSATSSLTKTCFD